MIDFGTAGEVFIAIRDIEDAIENAITTEDAMNEIGSALMAGPGEEKAREVVRARVSRDRIVEQRVAELLVVLTNNVMERKT
jgi:hypothetical protein